MTMLPAKVITAMTISEVAFLNRTIGCMFFPSFFTTLGFCNYGPGRDEKLSSGKCVLRLIRDPSEIRSWNLSNLVGKILSLLPKMQRLFVPNASANPKRHAFRAAHTTLRSMGRKACLPLLPINIFRLCRHSTRKSRMIARGGASGSQPLSWRAELRPYSCQ